MDTIHGLNKNGAAIVATGLVFTVLAVAAVALRFISKRITTPGFGVDDWLLLASLIIYVTAEILVIRSDIIGRQAVSPDDPRYKTYLQYVYIYSIFYFPTIALVQVSILFLYRHLFYPSPLRQTSMALVAVCAAWCIAASVIEIGYPGHTIGAYFPGSAETVFNITYLTFWLAMAIIETLVEIVILILTMREILRLHLTKEKKRLLCLIFALGGFVIVTGIVRMAVLYRPDESDFDLTQGDIWLNVHLGTAIISACLPTYRPLIASDSPLLQIFHTNQVSYLTDDTKTSKKRSRSSRSRQSREGIFTGQQYDNQATFADARRCDSISMTGMESQEDEAVESGTAIGIKQTVEVV